MTRASALVSRRTRSLESSNPFGIPQYKDGAVSLLNGAPALEALPVEDLHRATEWLFGDVDRSNRMLGYGPNAGDGHLLSLIAGMHSVPSTQVFITNGGLHGVSSALRVILDVGDIVAVDNPAFPDALRAIDGVGGQILSVPMEADGLDVDFLEDYLLRGCPLKAVYTVPEYHNPTGVCLSTRKQRILLELAERFEFLIISDNPYRVFGFDSSTPADFGLESEHVISVGTFSKTLGPGLRLGWVIAPEWFVRHLTDLRTRSDFQPPAVSQAIVAHLLSEPGWYEEVVRNAVAVYRQRAALAASHLDAIGDRVEWTMPKGGFFMWLKLADRIDPDGVRRNAERAAVRYSIGKFYDSSRTGAWQQHIRIAYSGGIESQLSLGLERLCNAIRTQ